MEEKDFISEYKRTFDGVHASDALRKRVLDAKPTRQRNHVITPFKATLGTIAAAIMIFAAVNEYKFEPSTDGVISETVVSTELPKAEFSAVATDAPVMTETPQKPTVKPQAKTEVVVATAAPEPEPQPTAEPEPQIVETEPMPARMGGRMIEEDVTVTECEPFDETLSGTVEPTETGFCGYAAVDGIYYIIEGTDETAVFNKMAELTAQ